jgi:hypothetical protein
VRKVEREKRMREGNGCKIKEKERKNVKNKERGKTNCWRGRAIWLMRLQDFVK